MNEPRTFEDIAAQQGWNADSREAVLMNFITSHPHARATGDDLAAFAQRVADEENGVPEGSSGKPVPDLQMEVSGEYSGNAYPETAQYRVRMRPMVGDDRYLLTVEDSSGFEINAVPLNEAEVEGILKVAETNHSLVVYEDDWKIPVNIERSVHWDLGDAQNFVRLDQTNIDEIATWLRYATGQETWDWAEDGSEWML